MRRLVGLLVLPLLAAAAFGQSLNLPQDAGKYHVSVCVRDTAHLTPVDAGLVRAFDAHPTLAQIKQQVHFHLYGEADPIFQANLARAIPSSRLPAVIVQRNREYSGPLYAASLGSTVAPLPETPDGLAAKLVAAFQRELGQQPQTAETPGEAVPGGPYWSERWANYCDRCDRLHNVPTPRPDPIINLAPNIDVDVPPLFPLTKPEPSMGLLPWVIVCGASLLVLALIAAFFASVFAGIWLWMHNKKKRAHRDLILAGASLGVGALVYQHDQHKHHRHEALLHLAEAAAAVLGAGWLAKGIREQRGQAQAPAAIAPQANPLVAAPGAA